MVRRSAPVGIRSYGPEADQVVEVWGGGGPVVALVHGGFWRPEMDLAAMRPLAEDAAARGWTAWNVEYRRGPGSWPACGDDVRAAVDGADAVIGHSAGGHLALWAADVAGRAVSLGGVNDVEEAERLGVGDGAVREMLGPDVPASAAQPRPSVPVLLVTGTDDDRVPPLLLPGADHVEVVSDHRGLRDPAGPGWAAAVRWLAW